MVQRYHAERHHMAAQLRVRLRTTSHANATDLIAARHVQAGRYRKRKALDCGKARCGLCSGHKRYGTPSFKDLVRKRRFEDSYRDYLEQVAGTDGDPK